LRHLALSKGRELWRGLAVLRSLRGGGRVIALVLVAVLGQILRNWMLLHAVGVPASFFDAIAVLIAVVSLVAGCALAGSAAAGRAEPAPTNAHRAASRDCLRRAVTRAAPCSIASITATRMAVQGHLTAPATHVRAQHRPAMDRPATSRTVSSPATEELPRRGEVAHMYTEPTLAPNGSPVPGVITGPVRVVDDTLGGNAARTPSPAVEGISDRPVAPPRRHPVTNLLARLLSVIRGDKLDATSGPRGPRTGSQTKVG
jgi:hypothetical protein